MTTSIFKLVTSRHVTWALGSVLALSMVWPSAAQTEFAWQYGSIKNPFSEDGYSAMTSILTFQNASSWQYGGSFFFIDLLDDDRNDGFNDKDFYGEWYPTLSISKVSGREISIGPVRDISLLGGLNFGGDDNIFKVLPGVQLSWSVPGFVFLNTDFSAIIDASDAPLAVDETGFVFDVSWLVPFSLGPLSFVWTGHAEYTSAVTNALGQESRAWILAQPQLTVDVTGKGFLNVGIELQYWYQKLGTDQTELVPQLLVAWRM